MRLDECPSVASLRPKTERLFELAGKKIEAIHRRWDPSSGTPVFTAEGRYTTRGWTEWTRGFLYGCPLLHFDATGEDRSLDRGRRGTVEEMPSHLTHTGVHDHGFNQISTFGNLRRLAREGKVSADDWEVSYYELALRVSGAVQASRWTSILDDGGGRRDGFVPSFNGPHSLFADTIRSMRVLALSWQLGHVLLGERDRPISLLDRLIKHARATARYNVYYGEGRDIYDTTAHAGRVAHESLFDVYDGRYRCPSSQQGCSPYTTWTRGLAWILCGFAELGEFFEARSDNEVREAGERPAILVTFRRAAVATAEWYLAHSFADGMVYWDGGAPAIPADVDYAAASDPYNDHEPIDSSAAAIAGQGFWRLARWLSKRGEPDAAERYAAAARKVASTLFEEPYLATDPDHEGLILHSIYHRPNGWDRTPPDQRVPCGESSLWGDYHAMELALLLKREAAGEPSFAFFDNG